MVKNLPANAGDMCRRCGFNPWVGKIAWRREWLPTPVFLPGEFHGQRNLVEIQSMGSQRVGHDWATNILLSYCCCSVTQSCPTLCDPMDCSMPGFPVLHHLPELLKLMSIESVMQPNHLILCRPLLLPPSIFPSIRVFSNVSALHILVHFSCVYVCIYDT